MKKLALLACLTLLPLAPARADVLDYVADRAWDLMDIVRVRGGLPHNGEGYGLKAKATSLAQVGFVHFDGHYWGIERRSYGLIREERTEGGLSLLYLSRHQMVPDYGNQWLDQDTLWNKAEDRRLVRNLPYWDDGRGDFLHFGAEVATPVGALDLGLYPTQAVDFLTGFVGIDPWNDDLGTHVRGVDSYRRRYHRPSTLPVPDPEAPVARKRAEMESLYGQLMQDVADQARQETLGLQAPMTEAPISQQTVEVDRDLGGTPPPEVLDEGEEAPLEMQQRQPSEMDISLEPAPTEAPLSIEMDGASATEADPTGTSEDTVILTPQP